MLAVLGAAAPRRLAPWVALLGALVPLGYAIVLLFDFDTGRPGLQYVTDDDWIPALGIHYKLGLDGLNLWLVALTALLFAAIALWIVFRPYERGAALRVPPRAGRDRRARRLHGPGPRAVRPLLRPHARAVRVPVLGWGGPERVAATLKFIIYTLVGSLLMLAGAVATAVLAASATGTTSRS